MAGSQDTSAAAKTAAFVSITIFAALIAAVMIFALVAR
jgi:hypothetical protein